MLKTIRLNPKTSRCINKFIIVAIASKKDKLFDPIRNTSGLAAKLRTAGVAVTEIYFDKTNHKTLIAAISWPLRGLAPVLDTVDRFVSSDGGRSRLADL